MKKTIAILGSTGSIGKNTVIAAQSGITSSSLSINNLEKLIEKLFSDKKCPAIALVINSPGGSPVQSALIANRILELSKEKDPEKQQTILKSINLLIDTISKLKS